MHRSLPRLPCLRRLSLSLSLFIVAAGLCAAAASAEPVHRTWELVPGMLVEGCGGFEGECRLSTLEGTLSLTVDTAARTAHIDAARLELVNASTGEASPFPPADDVVPLTDLVGTVSADGRFVEFSHPEGSLQDVSWLLLLSDDALVLNGHYDEGCCDRFRFTFENMTFHPLPDPASSRLLLHGGRFAVEVAWTDFVGQSGQGLGRSLSRESGYFWFFGPNNVEVTVKVLDACDRSGHFWVFAAGMTTVQVEMTVTDLLTGISRVWRNPLGRPFETISETRAFATCEAGA